MARRIETLGRSTQRTIRSNRVRVRPANVDVIVTGGNAALAVKQTTSAIPIIFVLAIDPVRMGLHSAGLSVRMYEPTDRRNPTHPIRLDGAILGFLGAELFFTSCILSFCCHMTGMTKGSYQQQKAAQKPKLARRQPRPFGYTNPTKDQLYAMLTDAWKNTQELSKRRKVGAVK